MNFKTSLMTTISVIFILCMDVFPKADITYSGDLQYRIRYHWMMLKSETGQDSSATPDLTNRYAWNLKLKISVNENLLFGIRLSNPSGYGTDNIVDNITWASKGNYNLLSIPELYFKWKVGMFSFSAGFIPVLSNTTLSLAAMEANGYDKIGGNTWKVFMNNSQKGMDFNLALLNKESYSLGMDLVAAIGKDAKGTDTADVFKLDQLRFILTFPTSLMEKKLTLLPAMHLRTNVYRSSDLEKSNISLSGGLDAEINLIDALSIKLGAAGGMFNNSSLENDTIELDTMGTIGPTPQTDSLGMLFTAGFVVSPGFGKAVLNFRYGRSRDREAALDLNSNVFFWEVKYGIPVKSLTIMPRLRIWYLVLDDIEATETRLRPELILKASF